MPTTSITLPVCYAVLSTAQRRQVREQYVIEQEGRCHYCKAPLAGKPADLIQLVDVDKDLFPPLFFKWPIHLHHDHDTGLTIGAVHSRCNAVLWQYFGRLNPSRLNMSNTQNLERFIEQYAQRSMSEEIKAQEAGRRAGAINLEDLYAAREAMMKMEHARNQSIGRAISRQHYDPELDGHRKELVELMMGRVKQAGGSIKVKVRLSSATPPPEAPTPQNGVPVVEPVDIQDHIMNQFQWTRADTSEWIVRNQRDGQVYERGYSRSSVNMELGERVAKEVSALIPMIRRLASWGLRVGV